MTVKWLLYTTIGHTIVLVTSVWSSPYSLYCYYNCKGIKQKFSDPDFIFDLPSKVH